MAMHLTTFSPKCCYLNVRPFATRNLFVYEDCSIERITYSDFQDKFLAIVLSLEGVENGRKVVGVEFDCGKIMLADSAALVYTLLQLLVGERKVFAHHRQQRQ